MTTQPIPQATAPSAEPVASLWVHKAHDGGICTGINACAAAKNLSPGHHNLYAYPPTDLRAELDAIKERLADMEAERNVWHAGYVEAAKAWDTAKTELSAMTAERDKLRGELRFTEMFHEERARELLADRDTLKTAHADTLAELRKVSEELGALKGERAEMAKKAELYEALRKLNPREFANLWSKNVHGNGSFDELVAAITAQDKP